jgi:hypothetical protein
MKIIVIGGIGVEVAKALLANARASRNGEVKVNLEDSASLDSSRDAVTATR